LGRVPLPFIGYFGLGNVGHKNKKNCVKTTQEECPTAFVTYRCPPNIKRTLAYSMQPDGVLYLLESAN